MSLLPADTIYRPLDMMEFALSSPTTPLSFVMYSLNSSNWYESDKACWDPPNKLIKVRNGKN